MRRSITQSLINPSLLASLLVGLFGAASANAAGSVILSGRVYNLSSGQGYSGVTISLCGAGSAITGPTGNWQVSVPAGTVYCARITGGAPAGLAGPATRNNSDIGASPTYESQLAGVSCYHTGSCPADQQRWDRGNDGGTDFVYSMGAPVPAPVTPSSTSAPVATPSVTPTPSATPSVTPTPSAPAALSNIAGSPTPSQGPAPTAHWSFNLSTSTVVDAAAIVAVIALILAALFIAPWRAARRRNFRDYLRAKYYDF